MFSNPFDDRSSGNKTRVILIYLLLLRPTWRRGDGLSSPYQIGLRLLGTAILAYTFGLRHAFDADHIAAIDNVVRKLMQEGNQPSSAGFFFSLGRSTIVLLTSIAIAATAAALKDRLDAFRDIGGVIGTSVSALFLLLIGIANLFILRGVWKVFTRARRGHKIVGEDLDALLAGRGLLARVFRPIFGVVSRSRHMYPIGFLFGLGFDTATEIGLLGISATQAARGMPVWMILVFPALFTAGMRRHSCAIANCQTACGSSPLRSSPRFTF